METYWLYYGDLLVTAVRMAIGSKPEDVRAKALADLAHVPLCDWLTENPGDKARRIVYSNVRVFRAALPQGA